MRDGTREEVAREIEPYRDTDFARLYWEAGMGDLVSFPSAIGRTATQEEDGEFAFRGERIMNHAERLMRERGLDPFSTALEFTHAAGLEFHAGYRPAGFYFPPPQEFYNTGGFYETHPELRMLDAAGRPQSRIAYSFPETRRYVVSLLRELATHPVDGIAILYNRAPPLVGYEPELVDGFRAETGLDARELAEDDERWLRYRGRALTAFMRELRAALDDLARETGRPRVTVSAVVMGRHADNAFYGMDTHAWAEEGIVDTLIPFTRGAPDEQRRDLVPGPHGRRTSAAWADLARRTGVTVALNLLPRWVPPSVYRERALGLYRAGHRAPLLLGCLQPRQHLRPADVERDPPARTPRRVGGVVAEAAAGLRHDLGPRRGRGRGERVGRGRRAAARADLGRADAPGRLGPRDGDARLSGRPGQRTFESANAMM